MASAWGASFGSAWGDAWGVIAAATRRGDGGAPVIERRVIYKEDEPQEAPENRLGLFLLLTDGL